LSVRVVNMRMLKPVDEREILRAARETALVVTVEDHFRTGALATILAETLMQNNLSVRVLPMALEKWFKPALLDDVLSYEGFTGPQIAERVLKFLDQKNG